MSDLTLPLADVVERVRAFETASVAERIETIRLLVAGHRTVSLKWGQGWRYRRARIVEPVQTVQHVDGLIWRKDVPARIGRANGPGVSVLYLGDRRDTALREVGAEDHDVVLGEFVIRPDAVMRVAPLGEIIQVQRTGRGFLTGDAPGAISDMINGMERTAATATLIIDAFLLDVVTQAEDDYALSSEVCMAIHDKLPAISAIAYPSRRQYGALNFAVRTERFWDVWGIVAVQRFHARHLARGFYELTDALDVTGVRNDGTLIWSDRLDPHPTGVARLDPPWYDTRGDSHAS